MFPFSINTYLLKPLSAALVSLATSLFDGALLLLPVPMRHRRVPPSVAHLLFLLLLLWALAAANDFIALHQSAEFSVWGVLSHATQSYLWLACLAFIVVLERYRTRFLSLVIDMASISAVLLIVWMGIGAIWWAIDEAAYIRYYRTLWFALLSWELIALARLLVQRFYTGLARGLAYTAFYGVAMYSILNYLPLRSLFVPSWDADTAAHIDVEAVYYAQANLLSQSLYALSAQRPGEADFYFIGFGAYAYEDVFKREIEQATLIFEQRFGAVGRTVKLINNRETHSYLPLANLHNLDRTIRGIAKTIDRHEDIVVIFLSSHGSEDGSIAVEMPGFGLNNLTAGDVRRILDEHEIKWRVIIISACYSGSFIDTLATPNTLVITAAAADRASFGCQNENDWTYFGEALFANGLNTYAVFSRAFEHAREWVDKREKSEGKTPSRPQLSLGEDIAAYLTKLGY